MKRNKKSVSTKDKYLNKTVKNAFDIVNKLFSVSKYEYDNTFVRRNKLDNKINILFTAYAFFVLLYVELLKSVSEHSLNKIKDLFIKLKSISMCKLLNILCNCDKYIKDGLIFTFCALFIIITILLLYNIRRLLILLSGIELSRFDSNEVLSRNMFELRNLGCIKFIIGNFEQCKNDNNNLLDEKYIVFNDAIKLTIRFVVLLVLEFLISIFIQ